MRLMARDRLGVPGGVGFALLVFSIYFALDTLVPAEEKLTLLQAERSGQIVPKTGADVATVAAALPLSQIPELLKQWHALVGGSGLVMDRVTYLIEDHGEKTRGGTTRVELTAPLKGSYPAIRALLRSTLALSPAASLDELGLQRAQVSDSVLTGQARISYLFSAAVVEMASPWSAERVGSGGASGAAPAVTDVFAVRTWEPPPPPPEAITLAPPAPPEAPPLPFRFLGRVVDAGRTSAFLVSHSGAVFVVAVGEPVAGDYRLERYQDGKLIFLYRPMNVRQTLATGVQP